MSRFPTTGKDLSLHTVYRHRIEEFLHLFLLWQQLNEGGAAPRNILGHGASEFQATLFVAVNGWLASLVDKHASALNVFEFWLEMFPEKKARIEDVKKRIDPVLAALLDFRNNVAFHANKSWDRQQTVREALLKPETTPAVQEFVRLCAEMIRAENASHDATRSENAPTDQQSPST